MVLTFIQVLFQSRPPITEHTNISQFLSRAVYQCSRYRCHCPITREQERTFLCFLNDFEAVVGMYTTLVTCLYEQGVPHPSINIFSTL